MKSLKIMCVVTAISLFFLNLSYTPINAVDTISINVFENNLSSVQLLSEDEIPEAVAYNEVLEKGHYKRLNNEEDNLNKLVFANTDGTQSCYLFNHPVKFIDNSGNIVDKSMEIRDDKTANCFVTKSSDISTTFGKILTDGVQLSYEDIQIEMIPNFTLQQLGLAELSEDSKTVYYKCTDDISVEYSLTYQGFKENIILSEYNGINMFSFTLLTNGLELSQNENGKYNLYDKQGNEVANIGDIIVFDADSDLFIGEMCYETIINNQEYLLTIFVDKVFLTDSETDYPVCIDPTIEISYDYCGANGYDNKPAIEHTTLYSNDTWSSNSTMIVGKTNSSTIARTLMRFPALINNYNSGFLFMDTDSIISANVYLRDVGYQSDINAMDVYCYQNYQIWETYQQLTWEKYANNHHSEPLSVRTICHSNGVQQNPLHTYAFDITSLVKKWTRYINSVDFWKNGIILKADETVENGDAPLYCSFGAYNTVYYAPYLVIDYNTPYGYEYAETAPITYTYHYKTYLNAGETYIFETEKATNYIDTDTELYLFKEDMTTSDNSWYNDDKSINSRYSKIEVEIKTSGYYILMAKQYSSLNLSGSYPLGYCNVYKTDPETKEKTLLKKMLNLEVIDYLFLLT